MDLKGKCVLVTGANGFIGTNLCRRLVTSQAKVIGLVGAKTRFDQTQFESYMIDITDEKLVSETVKKIKPEYVIHLAGYKNRNVSVDEYRLAYQVNLIGTLNVVEACHKFASLERFVFLGTCDEYGKTDAAFHELNIAKPLSAYGITKLSATQLLQTFHKLYKFPAVILRPSVVYGPGQGDEMFIPSLIKSLIAKRKFKMTPGEQSRDFIYVDDLVDAILLSMLADDVNGQILNLSAYSSIKIKELALSIVEKIGKDCDKLLKIGAVKYRVNEIDNYSADNTKAKKYLNWEPATNIDGGIQKTIDYYKSA